MDKHNLAFIVIFAVGLLLRVMLVSFNSIGFAYDQSRDMLDIRNIVVGLHPTLIGPTTSLNGVFMGPFWYYLNVPSFIAGAGNPMYLVYWLIILYLLTALLIFLFFKKTKPILGLLSSAFFLMSPLAFYASKTSWSAYPMPVFITLFFLSLLSTINKPASLKLILHGLIMGLALQIEAAFGVLLLPFTLLFFFSKKIHFKYLLPLFLGFGITLVPQILFEIKHGFVMTNTFLGEITGKSAILGQKLSLSQILISHANSYVSSTLGIFELPHNIINLLIIASVAFLLFRIFTRKIDSTNKQYFLISSGFILFSYLFYIFYPQIIKSWYLLGLLFPYVLIIAVFTDELLRIKKRPALLGVGLLVTALLLSSAIKQINFIPKGPNDRSTDENNYRNQLETVDWIYQSANSEGFKVFSYFPSVYDFPYQYLFWWYGTQKYGYQPDTISYLENVPEYIPNNEAYLTQKKELPKNYKTFLIIQGDGEMPERRAAWIGNFEKLCLKEKRVFPWNTEVWVKTNCSTSP